MFNAACINLRPFVHLMLALGLLTLLNACAPAVGDPNKLRGVFRSERPTNSVNGSFRQFEFLEGGTVMSGQVDSRGRNIEGEPIRQTFLVNGRTITIEPAAPLDKHVLYLPTTLTYLNERSLMVAETGEHLARVK